MTDPGKKREKVWECEQCLEWRGIAVKFDFRWVFVFPLGDGLLPITYKAFPRGRVWRNGMGK